MNEVIAQQNQNLFDIAIQEDGTIETAFQWALNNGLSVTSNLEAGQKLVVPHNTNKEQEVVNFFETRNLKPATSTTKLQEAALNDELDGIDYWGIGNDFEVQ